MLNADWSILQFTLNGNIELSATVAQFKTAIGRAPLLPPAQLTISFDCTHQSYYTHQPYYTLHQWL